MSTGFQIKEQGELHYLAFAVEDYRRENGE
jgi:hypothetical protein